MLKGHKFTGRIVIHYNLIAGLNVASGDQMSRVLLKDHLAIGKTRMVDKAEIVIQPITFDTPSRCFRLDDGNHVIQDDSNDAVKIFA